MPLKQKFKMLLSITSSDGGHYLLLELQSSRVRTLFRSPPGITGGINDYNDMRTTDLLMLHTRVGTNGMNNYKNGSFIGNVSGISGLIEDMRVIHIGTIDKGKDARAFKGLVKELIFVKQATSDAERFLIDNYLSSKWNNPLDNNDYYSGDTNTNKHYDYNVAGILKTSADSIINTMMADQILSFSNSQENSFIKMSGDSLFIGNKGAKNLEIRDVPLFSDGTRGERLNLTWYLDPRKEGGEIKGSINMNFNLSKIDKILSDQDKSSYILLYKKKLSDNFIKVGEATKKDKNLLSFENIFIVPDSTHLFDDKKQMKLTKGYFTLARYIQSSKIEIDTNLMGDNIVSDSEKSNVLISGGAFNIEDGEKVTITIENIIKEATVNGGRWSSTFNLSTINDGDIDIEASITLSNGLPVNSHKWTIQKDTEAPNLQQIYDVTNDNIIDAEEKLLGVTIKGIGEAYSTIYITYNNISFNTISDSNGNWSFFYKSTNLPTTGTSNITVYSIDKANNRSENSTKSVTVNVSVPIPRIKDNSEGDYCK